MTSEELLAKAKAAIAPGERSMREAAECIAAAQAQGASQRAIAEKVGKSAAWVNRLLAWRTGGFRGDAFGPAHHKERRLSAFTPGEHASPDEPPDFIVEQELRLGDAWRIHHERIEAGARQAEQMRAEAQFTILDLFVRRVPYAQESDRRVLVKALGMLGSNQAGDVQNAVRVIEDRRRKLNMTWDELIVPAATEPEQDAA